MSITGVYLSSLNSKQISFNLNSLLSSLSHIIQKQALICQIIRSAVYITGDYHCFNPQKNHRWHKTLKTVSSQNQKEQVICEATKEGKQMVKPPGSMDSLRIPTEVQSFIPHPLTYYFTWRQEKGSGFCPRCQVLANLMPSGFYVSKILENYLCQYFSEIRKPRWWFCFFRLNCSLVLEHCL